MDHVAFHVAVAASEEAMQQILDASREGIYFADTCEHAEGCDERRWATFSARTCHDGPSWIDAVDSRGDGPCPSMLRRRSLPDLPPRPPTPPPGFFAPADSVPRKTEGETIRNEEQENDDEEGEGEDETLGGDEWIWRGDVYSSNWVLPIFRLPMGWDAKRCKEFGETVCEEMSDLMFDPDSLLRWRDPFSSTMHDAILQYERFVRMVVMKRVPEELHENQTSCDRKQRRIHGIHSDMWVCVLLAAKDEPFA